MHTIDLDEHRKDTHGRAPEWADARRELGHAVPPDRVEAQLLQAFARHHARPSWRRRWTLDTFTSWASIGAMGCALAIVVAGVRSVAPLAPVRQAPVVAAVTDDVFLSLAPAEQIAAAAHPQLKRADFPRELLIQLGIPIAEGAPNELIHAELLVAATGEPLAIRLAVN